MNKRDSLELFEAWFNQTPNYYLILDSDHRIIRANAAMARFLCRPGENLSGEELCNVMVHKASDDSEKKYEDLIPSSVCPFYKLVMSALKKTRPGFNAAFPFSTVSNGTEGHYLLSMSCVNSSGVDYSFLSMEDVTQVKLAEEESERCKRMSALGNLAGRIAHDLNNICTVILGNVTIGRLTNYTGEESFEIMSNIEDATLKAADLGQELLTFSAGGAPLVKKVPLETLILKVSDDIELNHHVTINTKISKDLWPVMGDENQIQTAYRNVLLNAAEAVTHQREIKTLSANSSSSKKSITPRDLEITINAVNRTVEADELCSVCCGKYVELTISDNGHGIAADELDHVLTPFYSKKDGKDGLGLSTAWSIIERHKGRINISSNVDKGTTVSLLIPAAVSTSATASKTPLNDEDYEIKSLTESAIRNLKNIRENGNDHTDGNILIMDDNKVLRLATGEILKYLGWNVTPTANGEEALVEYKKGMEQNRPYDVVILDLTVPDGMGGLETMRELLKVDPQVKAIVSSGYHNDPIMANFWEYGFSDCVKKPYMASKLNDSIKELVSKNIKH
jgi:signal transduction histidine kinase/CheY-like chemotaxis protein